MKAGIRATIDASFPAPATTAQTTGGEAPASTLDPLDQLSYLADIVAELTTMAKSAGQSRLATILELAQDEADRQLAVLRTQSKTCGNR